MLKTITQRIARSALLALLVVVADAAGQTFNSGSTGAYGPMNITADTTLDLPGDGIFNCTTINIAAGTTLRFITNRINTPVYLLASEDIIVNGTIDVSGGHGTSTQAGKGG